MTRRPADAAAADRWPVWIGPVGFGVAIAVTVLLGTIVALVVLMSGGDAPADSPAATIVGTLLQDLALIGTAAVLASRYGRVTLADFGLRPVSLARGLGWTAAFLVAFYVVSGLYDALVEPGGEQDVVEELGTERGAGYLVATGFLVILIAPLAEELFFRGFFYRSLRNRLSPLGAGTVVGVVFGAIHYTDSETLSLLPILALLGLLFCLLYERTGSLYPAIAMHVVNNALALATTTDAAHAVPVSVAFGAAALGACVAAPLIQRRDARVDRAL